MDADQLFLLTMADLQARVASAIPRLRPGSAQPTPEQQYSSLMMAPLLRKLLLEQQPLVHRVNRSRRLKLMFPLDHWPLVSGSSVGTLAIDSDPYWLAREFIDREGPMTLKEMLATPVVIWNGDSISAADIIRHVAHVQGGVHFDNPKSDIGRLLRGLEDDLTLSGDTPALGCLAAIGRLVLIGLGDLRERVNRDIVARLASESA